MYLSMYLSKYLFFESGRAQNLKMAAIVDNLKKVEYELFRMSSRNSRNKKPNLSNGQM